MFSNVSRCLPAIATAILSLNSATKVISSPDYEKIAISTNTEQNPSLKIYSMASTTSLRKTLSTEIWRWPTFSYTMGMLKSQILGSPNLQSKIAMI